MTRHVYQGVKPLCAGAVAAMAAGTTLEEFMIFTGNDGDRGATPDEVRRFLAAKGIVTGVTGFVESKNERPTTAVPLPDYIYFPVLEYCLMNEYDIETFFRHAVEYWCRSHGIVTPMPLPPVELPHIDPITHREQVRSYITCSVDIAGNPMLVTVKGETTELNHALYWDGAELWDSALPAENNPVNFQDYKVICMTPLQINQP